ncbi:MAG: hypothetical protein KUG77_01060, partial [Nannocystaceae bacterium]|nr:hypothetical protein [Nannocystaceae bacterium]
SVVAALEGSLEHEPSPERRAALHYYAGEAYERTGELPDAVRHFVEAGRGGFHAAHALGAAVRMAAAAGLPEAHAEGLELLVEATTGRARSQALHALARLHRGPLDQPQRAVELLRDLLQLSPTDTTVIEELRDLLGSLERTEEGSAVLLAGIAHHRSWLRAGNPDALDSGPLEGLRRLFGAVHDASGVYLTACVLEALSPDDGLEPGTRPDDFQAERWPLPSAQEGRPLEAIAADLDQSGALDLLREGAYYFGKLPFDPTAWPPRISDALPANNAVVMVAQSLARALGLPTPLVFFDDAVDGGVKTSLEPAPCLMVGRRVAANPADPNVRDTLGRALFRLATGGDAVHEHTTDEQLVTLVLALCHATGQDVDHLLEIDRFKDAFDPALATALAANLPAEESLEDLVDFARAFASNGDRFHPSRLRAGFTAGQDRAGAASAGDPRPALAIGLAEGPLVRVRALISYLVSDDHLNLRRALGYHLGDAP